MILQTHTVRSRICSLIWFKPSENAFTTVRSISISSSVHFLIVIINTLNSELSQVVKTTYPAGDSAFGCNCIVRSPSLLKAAPAAVNISPTCKKHNLYTDTVKYIREIILITNYKHLRYLTCTTHYD